MTPHLPARPLSPAGPGFTPKKLAVSSMGVGSVYISDVKTSELAISQKG